MNTLWTNWKWEVSVVNNCIHTWWKKKAQHMIFWHRIAKRSRNCCSQQRYLVDYHVEEEKERERMVKQSNTFTSRSVLTLPSESLEWQLLSCQELVLLISAVFTALIFWGPSAAALELSGKPGPEKSYVFEKKQPWNGNQRSTWSCWVIIPLYLGFISKERIIGKWK